MRTWLPWTLAALFAAAGLPAILLSLYADRSRGRARCRRCAYRMEGAPSLTCPECGRAHRSSTDLLRPRRHPRILALGSLLLLLGFAAGFNAWVKQRPGDWWSLAPTSWLLSHIEKHDTTDARIALGTRLARGPLSAALATRLADVCRNVILDASRSPPEQAWAARVLGTGLLFDRSLIDPVVDGLLRTPSCAVRKRMLAGLTPSSDAINDGWISALVTVACDTTCPGAAAAAVSLLASYRDPPVVELRRVVTVWQGNPLSVSIWSSLCTGLGRSPGSPPEARFVFLQELVAHTDPILRTDANAALKVLRADYPREADTYDLGR